MQHNGPTALVLTRQAVPNLDRSRATDPGVSRGAYILSEAEGAGADVILIGTGSEVGLCVKAQEELKKQGVKARVVSMPSWDLFAAQDESYRNSILPKQIKKRVSVEAGATLGWSRWTGDEGAIIGIDRFGASAPGEEVLQHLGFTVDNVVATALRILKRT